MDICNINDIQALLARHGFRFSKSMGQNFLIDPRVPEKIAAASGADRSCGVLEIGPGIGPLTRQLSARAGRVAAVELDRTLLPVLKETLADCDNTEVIWSDVMKLDLPALVAEKFPGLTPMVCANLPYNITTPVLTALVESELFSTITVMIQREAALRICARPGSQGYGVFSILCQYYTEPELLFDVPPSSFLPQPKVTSSVVHLPRRRVPWEVSDSVFFFRVVHAAFALRRKTLLNSLSSTLGKPFSRDMVTQALERCSLPLTVRGEQLSIPEFSSLAAMLAELARQTG